MAKVAIIVGSDSDLEKASDACTVLEELGVEVVKSNVFLEMVKRCQIEP